MQQPNNKPKKQQKKLTYIFAKNSIIIITAALFLGIGWLIGTYAYRLLFISFGGYLSQENYSIDMLSEKQLELSKYSLDIAQGKKEKALIIVKNTINDSNYIYLSHSAESLGEINCSNLMLEYKSEVYLLPEEHTVLQLLIESREEIQKGTCFVELKSKDSNNNTAIVGLTVNVV